MLRNVAPVIFMIIVGFIFRQTGFISEKGIEDLKKLAARFMLPVVMFHAFATVSYTRSTMTAAGCVFVLVAATFFGGYLVKPFFAEPYKRYIPFVTGVYESGMITFPLYMSLFGQENLHYVAMFDVANTMFFASVFLMMLTKEEDSGETKPLPLFLSVLKGPVMIGTILGIIAGAAGIMGPFLSTSAGQIYLAVESMITTPLSAIILIVLGYGLRFEKTIMKPILGAMAVRVVFHTALAIVLMLVILKIMPDEPLARAAVLIFAAGPSSYSTPAFSKRKEGVVFTSTFGSCYMAVTIIVFAVTAAVFSSALV